MSIGWLSHCCPSCPGSDWTLGLYSGFSILRFCSRNESWNIFFCIAEYFIDHWEGAQFSWHFFCRLACREIFSNMKCFCKFGTSVRNQMSNMGLELLIYELPSQKILTVLWGGGVAWGGEGGDAARNNCPLNHIWTCGTSVYMTVFKVTRHFWIWVWMSKSCQELTTKSLWMKMSKIDFGRNPKCLGK